MRTAVGGGIEKNETPREAVIRETSEEVGLTLSNITPVTTIKHTAEYKNDTIHVFVATAATDALLIDRSEIKEAGWFDVHKLPDDISPLGAIFINQAIIQKAKKM